MRVAQLYDVFGFAPVPSASLGWCALAALVGVGWVEGYKAVRRAGDGA